MKKFIVFDINNRNIFYTATPEQLEKFVMDEENIKFFIGICKDNKNFIQKLKDVNFFNFEILPKEGCFNMLSLLHKNWSETWRVANINNKLLLK